MLPPGLTGPPYTTMAMTPALRTTSPFWSRPMTALSRPGREGVDLRAGVAQAGELDQGVLPELQERVAREPKQFDAAGEDVLAHLPGGDVKAELAQLGMQLDMDEVYLAQVRLRGSAATRLRCCTVDPDMGIALHPQPGKQGDLVGDSLAETVLAITADRHHHSVIRQHNAILPPGRGYCLTKNARQPVPQGYRPSGRSAAASGPSRTVVRYRTSPRPCVRGAPPAVARLPGLLLNPGPLGEQLLLAGLAVDRLAEQVGVPVVPGVFLDHVHEHPPQRRACLTPPGRVRRVERVVIGLELSGRLTKADVDLVTSRKTIVGRDVTGAPTDPGTFPARGPHRPRSQGGRRRRRLTCSSSAPSG